uniref:CIDE-N domain-containing protein n=1 Tax=Magallana gigas TaxID=29159 RepID=A0A8W8NUR7_MAGGI
MMAKWTVCGVSVFTLCAVFLLFAEPGHGNQCTRCWPASLFNRVMDCKDIYTGCILLMTPKNWAGIVREVKVSRCEVRIKGGGSLAMVRDRMGNLCKAFKAKTKFNVGMDIKFVLKEDVTEVDKEYFEVILNNTILMLLKTGEV